jgi:HrpA-like RNA helicase
LKIIETFREISKKQGKSAGRNFCREFFINEKSLFKALQIENQLLEYMKQILEKRPKAHQSEVVEDPTNLIVRCLYEGLPLNIAKRCDSGYMTEYTHQKDCYVHPSSVLHISMKNALGIKKSKYEENLNKEQSC